MAEARSVAAVGIQQLADQPEKIPVHSGIFHNHDVIVSIFGVILAGQGSKASRTAWECS